ATSDSNLFVLFASKPAAESPWVRFEIERARVEHIRKSSHRILIFPTSPDVRINDLPEWLRDFWMPRAGWAAADIARYITTIILEPDRGISGGVVRTIGRGKTLDELEQIAAEHLTRKHKPANVFVLAGFTGVGRRTFASYYMRVALAGDVNLVYGPT